MGKLRVVVYLALVRHPAHRLPVFQRLCLRPGGAAFALVVRRTRSILGVTLAHGLTNIALFMIFPLL
jgi:hypothetical protein